MPTAAPKPCTYPGCGVLLRDGSARCKEHKRAEAKAHDARRGTAHERGYSAAWQRARVGFLSKHPLCTRCQDVDRLTPATVVDHIVPHKGDKLLFWDSSNWQPLCKPCHDHKTATEDGGGWSHSKQGGGG